MEFQEPIYSEEDIDYSQNAFPDFLGLNAVANLDLEMRGDTQGTKKRGSVYKRPLPVPESQKHPKGKGKGGRL